MVQKINQKTGEITLFMEPWAANRPVYEKKFTLFDVQEILEKKFRWGYI